MKDGQNALFGSNAFVNRDSVSFSVRDPFLEDVIVGFNETTKTINLFVEDGLKYVMEIKNIRTDTIIGTAVVTGFGECCESYQLSTHLNSQCPLIDSFLEPGSKIPVNLHRTSNDLSCNDRMLIVRVYNWFHLVMI